MSGRFHRMDAELLAVCSCIARFLRDESSHLRALSLRFVPYLALLHRGYCHARPREQYRSSLHHHNTCECSAFDACLLRLFHFDTRAPSPCLISRLVLNLLAQVRFTAESLAAAFPVSVICDPERHGWASAVLPALIIKLGAAGFAARASPGASVTTYALAALGCGSALLMATTLAHPDWGELATRLHVDAPLLVTLS